MIDKHKSLQLARWWVGLHELKQKLDNELVPISGYLEVPDDELILNMQRLSEDIENHLNMFKLQGIPK
jgi:hypothetical protein